MSQPRTIYQLSPQEWAEIKKIAISFHDNNQFGGDQFKCAVAAFMEWISNQDDNFQLAVEVETTFH